MERNNLYLAIMSDILDSGTWANLGPAAKALYPVLCKFSNHTFKPVWPGTDELLRLTGFKTKKSLQEARRELIEKGLLHVVPGSGRKSSHYYFRFDYPGSKVDIEAHREESASRREGARYPREGYASTPVGGADVSPNHINIHINKLTQTTNHNNPDLPSLLNEFLGNSRNRGDFKEQLVHNMLDKYGQLEVGEAVKIAISRGKDGDIRYLEGILKNRSADHSSNTNEIADPFVDGSFPEKLKIWRDHLEPMGKFQGTWYFSPKRDLSPSFVEEQFKKAGISIMVMRGQGKPSDDQNSATFVERATAR